jgi:hypothetical protein
MKFQFFCYDLTTSFDINNRICNFESKKEANEKDNK